MTEPRFERHQLGEVLQKTAELQEGRGAPQAADKLSLLGLKQLSEEGTEPRAPAKRGFARMPSVFSTMIGRLRKGITRQ